MPKETFVTYKCPKCNFKEDIPKEVVDYFDLTDLGDPTVPPRFDCQKCDGKLFITLKNYDFIMVYFLYHFL
ncbi:MAG: hypothetical protein KID02_15555 [Clostridiales bacterium]|nr:hypothetical protein [Clostridiales bacterium]